MTLIKSFFLILFYISGHAGHDEPPARSIRKVPLLAGNENLYSLQAQVKHKVRQY